MTDQTWPELTFPDAEASVVNEAYDAARVILEYGSGGSTVLAASKVGKLVFSVETDRMWTLRLQAHIDAQNLPSPATVYHVDIGPTGEWGRPLDAVHWTSFHHYPLAIWKEQFFRHPDVVLIDGRFRAACMFAVMIYAQRPVTVLFDDYVERKPYHIVEQFVAPTRIEGRMAIFNVTPNLIPSSAWDIVNDAFAQVTYDQQPTFYSRDADVASALRMKSLKGAQS